MQHLASCPKKDQFPGLSTCIQAQVRFLAYHRIKPHVPPLVRAPVNSFEFQSCDRTPQVDHLCFRSAADNISPTASDHRLQRGLPGYLILFATHAFVPQRQSQFSKLPSQSVFCVISKHFTATLHIPPASTVFKKTSINNSSTVKLQDFITDLVFRLRTL